MKQENQEIIIANATTSINKLSNKLDSLATKRKLISDSSGLTKELLTKRKEQLDNNRKASDKIKKEVVTSLDGLKCSEACKIVTNICISGKDADKALKSRNQRKRSALKNILSVKFPDYDIDSIRRRRNGIQIAELESNYIGNEFTRQANDIIRNLTTYIECGYIDNKTVIPEKKALSSRLKREANKVVNTSPVKIDDGTATTKENSEEMQAIIDNFTATKASEVVTEEKQATN